MSNQKYDCVLYKLNALITLLFSNNTTKFSKKSIRQKRDICKVLGGNQITIFYIKDRVLCMRFQFDKHAQDEESLSFWQIGINRPLSPVYGTS